MRSTIDDRPPLPALSRKEAARQGEEAVAIASRGEYAAPSGRRVEIAPAVARAVLATADYPPDAELVVPGRPAAPRPPRITVVNDTSLASGRSLAARGVEPLVLNFASARKPGGGFLTGAIAQEESLARASALHACLVGRPMYDLHRRQNDPLYTSWMIYSPGVPVFRDDAGTLLEAPWSCAFLTAAAPNVRELREQGLVDPRRLAEVLHERVKRILSIAAAHGHRHLVLGAWGCGVFANDPAQVAALFKGELEGELGGLFEEVVFAVLDTSPDRRFVQPFTDVFG